MTQGFSVARRLEPAVARRKGNHPLSTNRLKVMSDKRVQTYDLYLAAWSAVPDAERAQMLRESLSKQVVFTNPQQTRHGLSELAEHLEGFQLRQPGGSFRQNSMVGWGVYALAEWQLVDAKGEPGFSGYDVLTFDEQGLLNHSSVRHCGGTGTRVAPT